MHERDPEAPAVYIRNVGTAFRCECGRYYVGGYGCPADKKADPPSAKELEGWHRRAAERVVRTYADAPPELKAEARRTWPSLGDALDALARIDALAELADDADESPVVDVEGLEAPVSVAPDPFITGSPVVRLDGLVAALREAADFYRPYERDSARDEAMAVVSEAFRYLSDQIEGEEIR